MCFFFGALRPYTPAKSRAPTHQNMEKKDCVPSTPNLERMKKISDGLSIFTRAFMKHVHVKRRVIVAALSPPHHSEVKDEF